MALKKDRNFKFYVTFGAVVLPIFIGAIGVVLNIKSSSHQSDKYSWDNLYKKAFALYEDKEFSQASKLVEHHAEEMVKMNQGCQLLISIFAEAKNMEKLEAVSRLCIKDPRNMGISQEGLAYSLSATGRVDEAISTLENEVKRTSHPRCHAALARLYLMVGSDQEAKDNYLKAISHGEEWELWAMQALDSPILSQESDFLGRITEVILDKEACSANLQQRVLALAHSKIDSGLFKRLEGRIKANTAS